MNKKKETNKEAMRRTRRFSSTTHILIAVAALIECLLLLAFTTYSWIESSSSLVIKNGYQSVNYQNVDVERAYDNVNITQEPFYLLNLDGTTNGTVNLRDYENKIYFFRDVEYYEFAKTTSPDGYTFFFPRRNNTHTNSTAFRKGDTTDYNTSYYYFDFVVSNNTESGKDFYFDPSTAFDLNDDSLGDAIFNATDSSAEPLESKYLTALRKAMRISVTSQVASGSAYTSIYSESEETYQTIDKNAQKYNDDAINYSVTTRPVADYMLGADDSTTGKTKLFNVPKGKQTRVSVRIWFDIMDPAFQSEFKFNKDTDFNVTPEFLKIPGVDIGLKLAIAYTDNDTVPVYFDDYTFSNAAVEHVTEEENGYQMWFHAYQPATALPAHSAGDVWLPMTAESGASDGKKRWFTGEATQSMMSSSSTDFGGNGGMTASRLASAEFVYADGSHSTKKYVWKLPSAPLSDYIFNAYSYNPNGSASDAYGNGVGLWQDDSVYTALTLLKFRDMSTGITTANYNSPIRDAGGTITTPNFRFMNFAAKSDGHAHTLIFANNKNFTEFNASASTELHLDPQSTSTVSTTLWSRGGTLAVTNAAMYYDEEEEVFKSYVPTFWLTGDSNASNPGCSFTYTGGAFTANSTMHKWYSSVPIKNDNDEYVYTALGYTDTALNKLGYYTAYGSGNSAYFTGVGTWGEVERIDFSTELIDRTINPAYRYMIGISITDSNYCTSNINGFAYYALIPDPLHMNYCAYVPADLGAEAPAINFLRYNSIQSENSVNPSGYWYGNIRYGFKTFYPVEINAAADTSEETKYTHGYWNLSVLVDGTYEHLIQDTLTDDSFGLLQYSYDNADWVTLADDSTNIYTHNLSSGNYRFFVPAEAASQRTVYWRWIPYEGGSIVSGGAAIAYYGDTSFLFTHDTESEGIFEVVTEALNDADLSQSVGD